jgi:hypothetical protein
MLWSVGWRVGESVEGLLYVPGHGYVASVVAVVPGQREAKVLGALPFEGEFVEGGKAFNQVLAVALVSILYAEIVDTKGELRVVGFVVEHTVGVGAEVVAGQGGMGDEVVVGWDASLWKAVHSFVYFNVDGTIVDFVA